MRNRPTLTVLALTLALTTLLPAVAVAAPEPTVTGTGYTDTELVAGRAPDGSPLTIAVDTVRDARGRMLSRETTSRKNPSISAYSESPYPCAHEGHRAGFAAHNPVHLYKAGKNDTIQYTFFPYSVDNAHKDEKGVPQKQWLICGTGGADADNGSRTMIAGPGVFYRSASNTFKIGQIWQEGKTPGSFTVSLGFQVARDPVAVRGGITQTPTDSLRGSFKPPVGSEAEQWARNGSNGWWESECSPNCAGTGGSPNYHGSVAEALYMFPQGKSVSVDDFSMRGYHRHFCSNWTGC